ncbi:MAG: HAD-IC family P-type ATPase [Gammaproteobacteria bacterium]|nr:HAD-IC family P-type ATPase [Gammaproteobacteria bacterium]
MSEADYSEACADFVKSVHAAVPGRVRFEVAGLYRNPSAKAQLESRLAETNVFRTIKASVLTGRVLLIFPRERSLDEIAKLVEACFAEEVPKTVRPRGKSSRQRQQLVDLLRNYIGLLRTADLFPWLHARGKAAAGPDEPRPGAINPQALVNWHAEDIKAVLEKLAVDIDSGLVLDEVNKRLQYYGRNSLTAAERRSDLFILLEQFSSAPVAMLGVSALISVLTGGTVDALVILGVVLINAAIGFVTERESEKTISSLAKSGVTEVNVLRDSLVSLIPIEMIVPGDVLLLTPGSYIAADIRLLDSNNLTIDESALTGESLPVAKNHGFNAEESTPLADRLNMAYMGTHVTGGSGCGVVVSTSVATELGQIQTMVGDAEAPETPMQRQLGQMGTQLALISGGVCAGVFAIGVLRGHGWLPMLKSAVSLAVAAVPEGLPAVSTTVLAMGIADMRRRNVSVRHLNAVETLGSVQVFCMDKTGTLTMNRMAVVSVFSGGNRLVVQENELVCEEPSAKAPRPEALLKLWQVVCLCSETTVVKTGAGVDIDGSPTEKALVQMAMESGIDIVGLRDEYPLVQTQYRAEGRPYMCTLHQPAESAFFLAVKGSPDKVLAMCSHQWRGGKKVRLTERMRKQILEENELMAARALRVLGAACLESETAEIPSDPSGLVWLGLTGMADPMRPGMDALIADYHRAGIATIMITGDQSATARAIGEQLGLSGDKPLKVLESTGLENLDPKLLAGLARDVHVFSRVSPAHKLQIVQALQSAGYIVAMTGDGINDGPALKAADIGVAMGGSGSNVARDVSDIILEDDNLQSMTTAIRQGRTIYDNIRKMIHFMVSTNLTEIEVMLAGIAIGNREPMNPMQLLWINLVTDIFPGLALALEPAEPGVMQRNPRDPQESIMEKKDLMRMTFESATIGLGTLGAYYYGVRRYGAGAEASTLAFNTLTINELAHAMSSRSTYRTLFGGQKLPANPHLIKAILGMGGLQALVSVLPGARRLLGTTPLNAADLLVTAGSVIAPLLINEFSKPTRPILAGDPIKGTSYE